MAITSFPEEAHCFSDYRLYKTHSAGTSSRCVGTRSIVGVGAVQWRWERVIMGRSGAQQLAKLGTIV